MRINELFEEKRAVVSFEVFPPKKDADAKGIYDTLEGLSGLNPDFISVTCGAGGTGGADKTVEIASFIQRRYSIPSLAHMTCVGADTLSVSSLLEEMANRGIENILALRGDMPEGKSNDGDYLYAQQLIKEIRAKGGYCIAAACYPEGHIECANADLDLERLAEKQRAGAAFFITQLFFQNDIFFDFLDRAQSKGITIPISAGVMPIMSRAQIERMIFMCGASLPSDIIKLLHKHQHSPEDLRKAGVEYAAAQMELLIKGGARGVHIYTMNKPEIAKHCMRHIGRL